MNKRVVGIAVLGFVLSIASRGWAQLDASQQQVLTEAKSYLTQLQTNLKLAQESAGPVGSTLPAARGRLALTRLDSTAQAIVNIDARLKLLPADDGAVKIFQHDYDAAKEEIVVLRRRISGPSTPSPSTPTARLDYRQEQALKDAIAFIAEVQGYAAALSELAAKVKTVADPNTIDHRLLVSAMTTIQNARQKAASAENRLTMLPPENPAVVEAKQQLASAVSSVDASEAVLRPIHAQLMKLVDPASYPNMSADISRLREFAVQYGNLSLFQTRRTQAAALVREEQSAKDDLARIMKEYGAYIGQQTEQSRQIEGASKYLVEKLQGFDSVAAKARIELPADINQDLAQIVTMADTAVKEQKPAFFGGGIPQRMELVEEKIFLFEALEPTPAVVFRTKYVATQTSLKNSEASLKDAIIAANALPPDRYGGADKEAMKSVAVEMWKKIEPTAQVLAVRFPSENWDRETMWRLQNTTWYKIDRSKLQAQLIIKVDDKVAAIRAINLWKDHLKNDQITANPLLGKDEVLQPSSYMLVEKVR